MDFEAQRVQSIEQPILPAICGALEQSSCGALSCWVRVVAEARDNRRNTREGGNTASVTPLKSNQKRGESYLVLRLVCAPVSWRLFPGVLGVWGLASGLLFRFCLWVWSRRVVLALLRRLVSSSGSVSKKRRRPRAPTQRPGFF